MNFAEEPQTPPTPPAEPTPAPAEPAPAEPAAPAQPAEPVDPNRAKIEALQSSLDAALEELSKGPAPKPAEPEPAAPAPAPAPAPSPAPAPAAPAMPKAPVSNDPWRSEIEEIRKQNEEFRNSTLKELENMKLKDEMIGLTAEVQAAVTKYPNADPDKILLEIEAGSDKPVSEIAKVMHEAHTSLVDKISKEQEEKIKAALAKENEGRIAVPQSSGTSSAPTGTPAFPGGNVGGKASQDAAWAEATKQAKANLQ